MWKVHLPATSYFKKQVKFFGTNHFLSVLRAPIRKSAGLTFFGRGFHEPHSWAPTDAGIHPDPDGHDHPPWNHDPKTGELLEGGLHPIDFIARDLSQRFRLTPEGAMAIIQGAIDRYNRKHDENSNHTLPNTDSPQWRKVMVGPYYDNSEPTHMRRVRGATPKTEGGPRPLVTYSHNRGNVGVEGGASGRWIDGGFVHINKELGEELEARGADPNIIKDLNYVKYNRLLPGSLSGGIVQSIGTQDWEKYQQTGQLPDHYLSPEMQQGMQEQRMHPEVHTHQLAELMPDHAFRMMGPSKGLTGQRLQDELAAAGVEHELSPEQLKQASRSAFLRLLFQPESQNIDSEKAAGVGGVFRRIFSAIDSQPNEEGYALHAQHAKGAKGDEKTAFAQKSRRHAEKMVARLSHSASKLMNEGMSQEDALNTVLSQLREYDGGEEVDPEYRNMVQGIIDKLLGVTGHEKFTFGDIPTDTERHGLSMPGIEMGHHEAPEHWHGNIIMGEHELAPIGSSVREDGDLGGVGGEPTPMADAMSGGAGLVRVRGGAGRFSDVPPQPTLPTPAQYRNVPSMIDLPSAPQQPFVPPAPDLGAMAVLPTGQRTLFDPRLYAASHDVVSDLDLLRKKLGYFDGFLRGGQ